MLCFPNAKINIGLKVTGIRPDGFHNIESIFYPVPLTDILEILPAEAFIFEEYGLVSGKAEDNLCVKAYQLIKNQFHVPPCKLILYKKIPAGSGLGGGSSDAVFTLKLVNDFFQIGISEWEMKRLALQLGSDCLFFLNNRPAWVKGRGEEVYETDFSVAGSYIVILFNPVISVSTAEAYRNIELSTNEISFTPPQELDQKDYFKEISNDFETYVFSRHPELRVIKNNFYRSGAYYASMTGSGSAIYALFKEKPLLNWLPEGWFFWESLLP